MKNTALWIGCILVALFCGSGANAEIIIKVEQVGSNVVATGSGTLDTTDVTLSSPTFFSAGTNPSIGTLVLGVTGLQSGSSFAVSGPASLGTGSFMSATTGTGSALGVGVPPVSGGGHLVIVPANYVSGTFLSSMNTWNNTTLAALGVNPGTYTYNWGSGAHADKLVIDVVSPTVIPEPGTLGLLGTGLIGLAGMARRKLKL